MKEFLLFLIKGIVDQPDEVSVSESEVNGQVNFEVKVAPQDMGKVIGKGGKIIKSLRSLLRVRAAKEQKRVNVTLFEE